MKHQMKLLSIGALAGVALAAQIQTVIADVYDGTYDDNDNAAITYDDETYSDSYDAYEEDDGYMDPYMQPCSLFVDYEQDQAILLAYAQEGAEGHWSMALSQAGPGGTTNVTQGGEIYADGPGPIVLSEMSIMADGDFTATLTTETQYGTNRCTVSG